MTPEILLAALLAAGLFAFGRVTHHTRRHHKNIKGGNVPHA